MARGRKAAKKKLPDIRRDAGTEAAQAKRAAYGTDGCDAIGRAYRSGLLGEDGQRLLQTGRSINRAYWAAYGQYGLTSALGNRVGAANDDGNSLAREKWLNATIREIDAMGREHRRAFDELVLDFHPDHGPGWLDRLILRGQGMESFCAARIAEGGTQTASVEQWERWVANSKRLEGGDWARLAKALEVLDELSD